MNPVDSLVFDQCARYPGLHIQDLVKALYQAALGGGHLLRDSAQVRERLQAELAACGQGRLAASLLEPLGPDYCRLHLRAMADSGLAADTLLALFVLSGQEAGEGPAALLPALQRLEELLNRGALPLDQVESRAYLAAYRAAGCPQVSHSDAFRAAHAPAYRVIRREYARYLPVFCALDRLLARQDRVLAAIEGGSAAGKTGLAALISQVYPCTVFHMDDFFLQAHQRTPERYAEPGGNVDYERFACEVLAQVIRGQAFSYRPFDCHMMDFSPLVSVLPRRLNLVEGAYSMHPALAGFYDASFFLEVDAQEQARRILRRNGPGLLQRFLGEWIPLEQAYFAGTDARARCTLVIPADTARSPAAGLDS